MASSPIYRATSELPRIRSSYSVPAQSRRISRGETPGSNRESKSFYNRSVTPSFGRSKSLARDDIAYLETHRQRVLSKGKVLEVFSEVERKYKEAPLEEDDEVDLMTETVYKSDGSIAQWLPDGKYDRPDWADDEAGHQDNFIQAGSSRRRNVNRNSDDADEDTESDPDSHYDMELEEEAGEEEEEEDEIGSWQVQEEDIREQLAHRKAALLLASMRSQADFDSDEEMEEFMRYEEAARARRMSAREEGRDSRCHTDNLSDSVKSKDEDGSEEEPEGASEEAAAEDSEEEKSRLEYRSPSKFTTIITDTVDDLFADDESGEDELALTPSIVDVTNNDHTSEESASDNDLQAKTDLILARARQVRSTWQLGESSSQHPRIILSPDSSPEPAKPETLPRASARPKSLPRRAKQPPRQALEAQSHIPSKGHHDKRDRKGKSRMVGERPTDHAVLDDVFGPGKPIDPRNFDHRRYRRSRYRQRASMNYKTCRFCREAEPARAELAEYCRGANHSKCCTFEYPPKTIESVTGADADAGKPTTMTRKYWQFAKRQAPTPISTETSTPGDVKRYGLTSKGLSRWRYFENLVKRPDKQTDRSCPYCRSSEIDDRRENATYCRGRIESKDCTFDGHKGSLRMSAKSKRPKEVVTPSQPPAPPPAPIALKMSTPKTPKTPTLPASGPDLTIDEAKLDIKLYYTSLIRDQQQIGYRFCPDCARSGDDARQRLSYWCRGRISYKACGHWDGDESRHRQRRRQSTDSKPATKSAIKASRLDAAKPDIPGEIVDSTSTLTSRTEVVNENGAGPSRKRGRPRKSEESIPSHFAAKAPSLENHATPVSTRVPDTTSKTDQRPQTEPIKRKPGRPRQTSLPGTQHLSIPAYEPTVPVLDRPGNVAASSIYTVADVQHFKRKRARPRRSAAEVSMKDLEDEGLRRKSDKPTLLSSGANITSDVDLSTTHEIEAVDLPRKKAKAWSEWRAPVSPSATRPEPDSSSRKRRSRTFDIVLPASRSSTPVGSSPARKIGVDQGSLVPISAMRNAHISYEASPHRLDADVGMRELGSLPPSSPPTSLSPSPSPRPLRFMPSGHRSSPLASLRQHDRSSSAFSEAGRAPSAIRGILRQSSEISDASRSHKRARVSFSLPRSPSPVEESNDMDYDSDSSDDVLLLSEGPPAAKRSAPATSSPLGPEARFAETPQAGRLSSSTLAAYARPLERTLSGHLGHAPSFLSAQPQAVQHHTARRSPLSSPPITSRSVPPSSNRGLMLPPPIPEYRLAPIPKSEPRPRGAIRARTAGAASRPRSYSIPSKTHKQPAQKLVAENIVIRRLINDVH